MVIRQQRGRKPALGRAGYLAAVVTALVAILLALGGSFYVAGVMYTTLARAAGDNSPLVVLTDSWKWAGAVCALAWVGVVMSPRRSGRGQAALLTVWLGRDAGPAGAGPHPYDHVPAQARRLRRMACGPAAGTRRRFAVGREEPQLRDGWIARRGNRATRGTRRRTGQGSVPGMARSAPAVAQLRALTRAYPGNYLAEDYDIPAYYLQSSVSWPRWSSSWYLSYTPRAPVGR